MKIKVKTKEFSKRKNKFIEKSVLCDVANFECKNYKCLVVGKWRHQGNSINGSQTSFYDNYYSCLHRNYHGCPDDKIIIKNKQLIN